MLNKRTQILLNDYLWQTLTNLAKTRKTSVAKLIREAIKEKYAKENELVARRNAIENILKHRPLPAKGRIDYKALINAGRKY